MDSAHLDAAAPGTRVLYDLGSGCGRLCVQVFLQFPNLEKVVGVEVGETATPEARGSAPRRMPADARARWTLTPVCCVSVPPSAPQLTSVRSNVGFTALQRLAQTPPKGYEGRCQLLVSKQRPPRYSFVVSPTRPDAPTRLLELHNGNLFDFASAWHADILICETNISAEMQYDFLHFLSNCKPGARLLTYNNLENMQQDVCARIDGIESEEHKSKEAAVASNSRGTRSGGGGIMTSARQQRVKPAFYWKRLAINGFVRAMQHAVLVAARATDSTAAVTHCLCLPLRFAVRPRMTSSQRVGARFASISTRARRPTAACTLARAQSRSHRPLPPPPRHDRAHQTTRRCRASET